MGCDFIYSGSLEDEKTQEDVIDFAKTYDALASRFSMNLNFNLNCTDETAPKNNKTCSLNLFGFLKYLPFGDEGNDWMEHGQIIFDRNDGGKLVKIRNLPDLNNLHSIRKNNCLADPQSYIEPNGYNRTIGNEGFPFALFLYVVKHRFIPNLHVVDDYSYFKDVESLITEYDLHHILMDKGLNYDACIHLFKEKYDEWFHAKEKKTERSDSIELSHYLGSDYKVPENPMDISLEDVFFSVRTHNIIIKKLNLITVADLMEYSAEDLMKLKNIGEKSIKEINTFLNFFDLKLN